MKPKYIYTCLAVAAATAALFSCTKEMRGVYNDAPEREFMTMFRKEHNTAKSNDPYACTVENLNDIHLYWYGVDGCAGYEIKMALQPNVSSGLASDWENPANILFDTIVKPDVLDLVIKHLNYSTSYRFAIRTLSKKGAEYHSKWYGYGNGRQWADWFGLDTEIRYDTPDVFEVGSITKTSFRVNLDLDYASSGDPGTYKEHFEVGDDGRFVVHYIQVTASPTNPDAAVPPKWHKYYLTDEDKDRGYVEIDGLQKNSVYVVNVVNENIKIFVDAIYNTRTVRTDGDPGEPIFLKHEVWQEDTIPGAVEYKAMCLDKVISDYTNDAELAEGTIYELEGGKAYYFASNPTLCKGFTMRTRAEDLAKGLRAKIYLGGMSLNPDGSAASCNFMFGRPPQAGESDAPINVKSLVFEGIDFDSPLATNFGDGKATGNYFANMYSNGMAVTFSSFEVRNCTFQRMIRGFIRVQGSKRKIFENMLIEGCLFYNCGYYDNNGRGYAWFAGDGKDPKSNIYKNLVVRNNTFYDSPRTCMFTDNGKSLNWPASVQYNITLENNTFVNFSTRSSGRKIFDLRYLPSGSRIVVRKNLFIQTAREGDKRNLYFEGMDIRQINGASKEVTFDIADNYSSSSDAARQINDKIFTSAAFSAKKNSAGAFINYSPGVVNGTDALIVRVGQKPISPTELMRNPNPPHKEGDKDVHEIDNLDGLYFNNTEQVRNHEIYTKGVGDPRWRESR